MTRWGKCTGAGRRGSSGILLAIIEHKLEQSCERKSHDGDFKQANRRCIHPSTTATGNPDAAIKPSIHRIFCGD